MSFELLRSSFDVSRETYHRLSLYHDALVKWQSKINLVGSDTLQDAWKRHFLDSLQLMPFLLNPDQVIVDLGTGAGFPGMVLAIAGYKNIHVIESDARKIAFLREVARLTETHIFIHHARIGEVEIPSVDVLVSRACAPLGKLLELSQPYVSRETICLFHKGKNYSMEHEEASQNWGYDLAVTPSIVDAQSVILTLSHLRKV